MLKSSIKQVKVADKADMMTSSYAFSGCLVIKSPELFAIFKKPYTFLFTLD